MRRGVMKHQGTYVETSLLRNLKNYLIQILQERINKKVKKEEEEERKKKKLFCVVLCCVVLFCFVLFF